MDLTVCSQPLTFDEQHSPRKVKSPRLTAVAPAWASADRQVVDCDSLDLTLCLRHVDDATELNFSVAGRRTFFSNQLGCNPLCLYFLFDSQYFLLFHSECSKGFFMGRPHQHRRSDTDSKPQHEGEKHHEGKRLIFHA